MSNIHHTCFVQQGDSQTLRVANQVAYLVIDQAWQERGGLLNTTIVASYSSRSEAEAHVERLKAEARR